MDDRLEQQIRFVIEIDKLKTILRRTMLMDESRSENSAEHSWHLAVMTILLAEYADEPIDALRVMEMVLVHDLVEIDAGDTYCYDAAGYLDKAEREQRAAARLFALLPADQNARVRGLWDEFELGETADARFANALDRLQPLLHNYQTGGKSWRENGISVAQVLARMAPVRTASAPLWAYVERVVADSVARGYLPAEDAARFAEG